MAKILIADPIAPEGVDLLRSSAQVDVKHGLKPEELLGIIGEYEALMVRSETKVTKEVIAAAKRLKVVARAGIGVDNIDLDAATGAGIAVVNAPTGNTVAAAEHTLALMLALARNIPDAHHSVKGGQWRRSAFMGVEVRNKTLGIAGLGRVGTEVARRAQSFGMRLLGYDPFVAPEYARRLGVELMSLDDLLAQSDFVTLHTPLTESTHNLIGAPQLSVIKHGARLINVARGELVDEEALLGALESGRLAGVALDVFSQEPPGENPLLNHPNVVATPHLGASTQEAQREVAVEAAEQVLAVLAGEPALNTVNAPFLTPEVHAVLAPYIRAAMVVGRLLTHLAEGQFLGITIGQPVTVEAENERLYLYPVVPLLILPIHYHKPISIPFPIGASHIGHPPAVGAENRLQYATVVVPLLPVHHQKLLPLSHIGHLPTVRAEHETAYLLVMLLLQTIHDYKPNPIGTSHIGQPPTVRTRDDGVPHHRRVTLVY